MGELSQVEAKILTVFNELFEHDGFSRFEVDMKLMKRGQKEVIIKAGKEHRFIVDYKRPENGCHCPKCD